MPAAAQTAMTGSTERTPSASAWYIVTAYAAQLASRTGSSRSVSTSRQAEGGRDDGRVDDRPERRDADREEATITPSESRW